MICLKILAHHLLAKSLIGPELSLKNYPTRAVTGSKWDGSEMNWQQKPEHYAAVHFHEDDIYDFEWDTDFKFKIPERYAIRDIYLMRIEGEGHEDSMPFFVAPKNQKDKNQSMRFNIYLHLFNLRKPCSSRL